MASSHHTTNTFWFPSPAAQHRRQAFIRLDCARDCRLSYVGKAFGMGRIHTLRTPILAGQHQCLESARGWLRGIESASMADERARRAGFRLP